MALAGLLCMFAGVSLAAAEDFSRPSLNVSLTIPGMYNDNFGTSRTDRVEGLQSTPTGLAILKGTLSHGFSYTVTAGVIVDRYDRTGFDGDTARSGFKLSYTARDWVFDASYESRWVFTPTFEDLLVRSDNFVFLVTAPIIHLGQAGDVTVQAGYRERVSTDVVSSHHSPYAIVSWEKPLDKDWKLGADLLVRYLQYDRGRAITARDWLFSKELSLTRTFSPNVDLKFSAAHENRNSNILDREYDNWLVGATLTLKAQIF